MNATKTALALVATLSALLLTACAGEVGEANATVTEQEFTLPENGSNENGSGAGSSGRAATFQDVFGTTTGVVAPQDPIENEPHPFPWKKVETSLQRPPRVQPADPSKDHASSTGNSGSTGSTSDDSTTPKP